MPPDWEGPLTKIVEAQAKAAVTGPDLLLERGHAGPRIVVGVDGSKSSKDALRWAARQADLTGASLDVVMSWELPIVPYGAWTGYDAGEDAQRLLDETVDEVLGETPERDVVITVAEGEPAVTLLEAAKRADLLVVGGRGDGPFAGLFLGSVGHRCVTHAPCPVVVVPHYR